MQPVRPGATRQHVVPTAAPERIVASRAVQSVGAVVTNQFITVSRPCDVLNPGNDVPLGVTALARAVAEIHRDACIRAPVGHPVRPGASIQPVCPGAPCQRVVAAVAPEVIVAGSPVQTIRSRVAGHPVVAGPGNEVLNQSITRNNQVADQTVHVRDSFRAQVHPLIIAVRAQVQRVVAAVVIQRQRDRAREGGVSLTSPCLEEFTQVALHVGLVTINSITSANIGGYTVEVMARDNVRNHRCDWNGIAGINVRVPGLAEV